jgi:hypothetical protein
MAEQKRHPLVGAASQNSKAGHNNYFDIPVVESEYGSGVCSKSMTTLSLSPFSSLTQQKGVRINPDYVLRLNPDCVLRNNPNCIVLGFQMFQLECWSMAITRE